VRRYLRQRGSTAPLAIAAFIAIPLFFSSLMAATLALEKPRVVQWTSGGKLLTTWHEPSGATTAKIWLWALLPPLVLILVGWLATRLPYGFYISCVSAIVIAMAVVHKTGTWERHHTQRFRNGVDLIPASNVQSNKFDPGQWEKSARETTLSLEHWTIGLAVICVLAVLGLRLRKHYLHGRRPPRFAPIESVHAPDVTPPSLD
jgi:hypothetical protein